MGRRFELLAFDWDGTLMDSTRAIVAAIQASCRDLGLAEPSYEQASEVIGLGLSEALLRVAPDVPAGKLPLLVDRYRFHYLSRDADLCLFDGMSEMVAELHGAGYILTVATGKSRLGLNRALEHSGLGGFFQGSRCADECFSKPHPQMLLELMDEFFVAPENVLMIGDTTHDLQMAINAGVSALAVSYGAHTAPALDALQPLARLETPQGLSQWLLANA